MMKNTFTLIELVMVIVILGFLAVTAIPKFYDLSQRASNASEAGVVAGVRGGIHVYYTNQEPPAWPAALDSVTGPATCNSTNPCFDNVLAQGGVTEDWSKDAAGNYTGPNNGVYNYSSVTGAFLLE